MVSTRGWFTKLLLFLLILLRFDWFRSKGSLFGILFWINNYDIGFCWLLSRSVLWHRFLFGWSGRLWKTFWIDNLKRYRLRGIIGIWRIKGFLRWFPIGIRSVCFKKFYSISDLWIDILWIAWLRHGYRFCRVREK